MADFTWDISFQLIGTYSPSGGSTTSNVTATVTGTIVTDSDSGILQQSDFGAWSFTYSAPVVGFSGSVAGDQSVMSSTGSVFSASGDTLSYVFDHVTSVRDQILGRARRPQYRDLALVYSRSQLAPGIFDVKMHIHL